jgi:hypothetical protein
MMATIPPGVLTSNLCDNSCELPALLMLGQEQQLAAVQLSHYVYKLLSIISQQMTSIHRFVLFCSVSSHWELIDNSSNYDTVTIMAMTVVMVIMVP